MADMSEVHNQRENYNRVFSGKEASYTALLNIHALKHQINQACLLHATDITEEISSFGGTINSSLQQLYTGLSLGSTAGLIPSTSQAYLICPSSSRNTEKQPSAEQHFHTKPYTNLLFCKLSVLNESQVMLMGDMRGNQYCSRDMEVYVCKAEKEYVFNQCHALYMI